MRCLRSKGGAIWTEVSLGIATSPPGRAFAVRNANGTGAFALVSREPDVKR